MGPRYQASVRMRRVSTVSVSIALPLAPAASRYRRFEAGELGVFPLLDRGAVKAPIATHAKTWETSLPEEAIDSGRMDAQMLGEFSDGEDIVPSSHLGRAV